MKTCRAIWWLITKNELYRFTILHRTINLTDIFLEFQIEIEKVLALGVDPSRIVYANSIKQTSFIKYSAQNGVDLMTFDNEEELVKIKSIYPSARYYNETCLKRTLNKPKSCINRTLNRVLMKEIFVNLTCINRTPVYSEHKNWFQGSSV